MKILLQEQAGTYLIFVSRSKSCTIHSDARCRKNVVVIAMNQDKRRTNSE